MTSADYMYWAFYRNEAKKADVNLNADEARVVARLFIEGGVSPVERAEWMAELYNLNLGNYRVINVAVSDWHYYNRYFHKFPFESEKATDMEMQLI
jgi:hypothetical protein